MVQRRLHLLRAGHTVQTVEGGTERGKGAANIGQVVGDLPGDIGIALEDTRHHVITPYSGYSRLPWPVTMARPAWRLRRLLTGHGRRRSHSLKTPERLVSTLSRSNKNRL